MWQKILSKGFCGGQAAYRHRRATEFGLRYLSRIAANGLRMVSTAALVVLFSMGVSGLSHGQDFRNADNLCSAALEQRDRSRMIALLGECGSALQSIKNGLNDSSLGLAPLSVRVTVLDALRRASELDPQKDRLGLLRLFPRVLRLVGELATADRGGTGNLARLHSAIWGALLAASDQRQAGRTVWTMKAGETLIYQMYADSEQGLRAVELVGNPNTRQADWREALPTSVDPLLAQSIETLKPRTSREQSPGSAPRFVLVLSGKYSDLSVGQEREVATRSQDLQASGILPVVVEGQVRMRPFTLLPTITTSSSQVSDRVTAVLVLRPHNIQIGQWEFRHNVQFDFSEGIAVANETGKTLKMPAGAVKMSEYIPVPSSGDQVAQYSVPQPTRAAITDREEIAVILPEHRLREVNTLGDWGSYTRAESSDFVWLRRSEVRPVDPARENREASVTREGQIETLLRADYVIKGRNVNVRTGPGVDHTLVASLSDGASLRLIEEKGEWGRFEYAGGSGWISMSLVSPLR